MAGLTVITDLTMFPGPIMDTYLLPVDNDRTTRAVE
jgi:hypothetical protein